METFELGRDALSLLRSGAADVAVVFETPLLRAAFEDDRLRVLTTLHTSTRNTRLVSRADRGISGFSELGGRRVGVARGTNADFFVDLALGFGGVHRSELSIVDLSPEASVAALESGAIDAAVLSDPSAAIAEGRLGAGARTLQAEVYAEVSVLVTRADVLSSRRPALRALLRGLACAERSVRDAPEASLAHLLPVFPEHGDAALREQLARVARGLGLDNLLVDVLRNESRWLRDTARGRGLDLGRLIDASLLEEVVPDAVMLMPRPRGAP
jgi:NitT/TauT family transport system substrate-binding protein